MKALLVILFLGIPALARPIGTKAPKTEMPPMAAGVDPIVATAMPLAFRGKLEDPKLIRQLEQRASSAPAEVNRLFAAYLLSYAPLRLLKGSQKEHVEKALQSPNCEALLGKSARMRLLRLRADLAFEDGQFAAAADDFAVVAREADPLVREYAILKLGWAHMNGTRPDRAYAVWLDRLRRSEAPQGETALQFYAGLGQALAENRARKSEDVRALNSVQWKKETREAFAKGVADGLDILEKSEDLTKLVSDLSSSSLYNHIAEKVAERSAAGQSACRFLPWLDSVHGTIARNPIGLPVEACAHWVARAEGKDRTEANRLRPKLELALERVDAHESDRRPRFDYRAHTKQFAMACDEGRAWMSEVSDRKRRRTIPAKEISAACKSLAEATPQAMAYRLRADLEAHSRYLDSEADPFSYLLVELLEVSATRTAIAEYIAANPSSFRKTLLPSMVAERIAAAKESSPSDLAKLYDMFGADHVGKADSVWSDVFFARVASHFERNEWAQAYSLLDSRYPLKHSQPPVGRTFQAWGAWLSGVSALPAADRPSNFIAASKVLLLSPTFTEQPTVGAVVCDALAEAGEWIDLLTAVKPPRKSSEFLSEKARVALVTAITDGKIAQGTNALDGDADVRFLVAFGRALRDGGPKAFHAIAAGRKSPLEADLRTLQDLEKRTEAALSVRASAKPWLTVENWIGTVGTIQKRVKSNRWTHPRVAERATGILSAFCGSALARVPELDASAKKAGGLEPAQWLELSQLLTRKLEECGAQAPGGKS